jgi:hypothetical protein
MLSDLLVDFPSQVNFLDSFHRAKVGTAKPIASPRKATTKRCFIVPPGDVRLIYRLIASHSVSPIRR